ncbi:MAG TPA: YbaB/EbfC family nucleoid-associated protein [Desulfomonilia bacterium]|jgi:DNA-binding YbaB/EbfC family protein
MEINLTEIMKQVQNIQSQVKDVQDKLSRLTVTSESGGGMVSVTVTGRQEIKDIKLDPICVDPRDVPMLEALIIAAVNQGIKKSKELSSDEMKKLTGGIPLPIDLS